MMEVWVDTDMGADDVFALLLLAREVRIAGVSLCFGVSTLNQARRNASGALAAFGWKFPVYAGAGEAVLGGTETAARILGPTGIQSRGRALPETTDNVREGAFGAMSGWLSDRSDARILALAPLTNLAILALARPDLLSRIRQITWMGGGITRGNHTPHAEFNAFADPEALALLLARGAPVRMIDLDACRQVKISETALAALDVRGSSESDRYAGLLADLLGGYLDVALARGRSTMSLYDPVAAAALVRPDLFEFGPARVDVDLCGAETRGRTIVETESAGSANAEIVRSLDAEAVKRLCLAGLDAAK